MKKLFIIGTGRNGSKLTAYIMTQTTGPECLFGEIHHGLNPIFFKSVYDESITKTDAIRRFKNSRDSAMEGLADIYIEKNHLIVPILEQVLQAYEDAMFLYVPRYPKDIIRSLYSRNVYSGQRNIYEDGRLAPNTQDPYHNKWNKVGKFEKVCWYVFTMTKMCTTFLDKLDSSKYYILSYDDFTKDPMTFKDVYEWVGLEFDIDKIKSILGQQQGSSARAASELNFEVNPQKVKGTQHWKDWSEEKNEIYGRFFDK